MPWSPSRIGTVERHCPKCLDHQAAETPYDRAVFGAGVSAHHVLQAVGEHEAKEGRPLEPEEAETVAADVLRRLVSDGRTFAGHKEPPLNAASAAEGCELALEYLDFYPLPQGAKFEIALAVDEDWQPCSWSDRHFGCILDVVYESEDFATEAASVVVVDYKTSWQADRSELDTLGRKFQACVIAAHYPDVDEVWLEVHNLRSLHTYRKAVPVDSPVIARWRLQVETVTTALETDGRVASPGAGCQGCPYLLACPEAQDYFDRSEIIFEHGHVTEKARAYAVAVAMVGRLRKELKPDCEHGPIEAGDSLIGFVRQERRKPVEDMYSQLWDKWQTRNGTIEGLLRAMKPGKSQLENAAKTLWPERSQVETRNKFIHRLTEPDNRAVFKAVKKKGE